MGIFVDGTAFPIGIINANGWGVPFTESENAIATLKSSVVRVCSRMDPHGCDVVGDPFSEIGHVVDAWREGDDIKVKAEITDSVAAQKIEDNTWKNNWSVFVGFNDVDSGGWVHGIAAESITIVNDPAWPTSTWKVVSAADGTKKGIRITSEFSIHKTAAANNEGDNTPEESIEDLKQKLADAQKEIDELKKAQTPPEEKDGGDTGDTGALEKEVSELKASNEALKKQAESNKKLIASLQVDKAKMIPVSELEKHISAALENHDKELSEKHERDTAFASFAAARTRLGIKTEQEDYKSLSAADLTKLAEDLGSIKTLRASGSGFSFPAGNGGPKGSTVGRYDSIKKVWVN